MGFVQGRVEGKGGAWYALHDTAKAIAESVGASPVALSGRDGARIGYQFQVPPLPTSGEVRPFVLRFYGRRSRLYVAGMHSSAPQRRAAAVEALEAAALAAGVDLSVGRWVKAQTGTPCSTPALRNSRHVRHSVSNGASALRHSVSNGASELLTA